MSGARAITLLIELARLRHRREHPVITAFEQCTDEICQQVVALIRDAQS